MDTREVQEALVALGFDPGLVDGQAGSKTNAAVVAFQERYGLYPDGVAGAKTKLALTAALEAAAGPIRAPAPARQSTSAIGLATLISREDRKLNAYKDTVGVWTIGIGHTAAAGPPIPYEGLTITVAEADAIFARDIVKYEDVVRAVVSAKLADHQFDALTSICFNIGLNGFRGATFVKRINAGESAARIRAAILLWRKPSEILSRRTAEADQFVTAYGVSPPKARSTDPHPVKRPR